MSLSLEMTGLTGAQNFSELTFQNHLLDNGMITVQRVSAAAEIIIIAIRRQHIVNIIVKPFETEGWSLLISFCRMVKYHIQNHFNAIIMKCTDQFFQFQSFLIIFLR